MLYMFYFVLLMPFFWETLFSNELTRGLELTQTSIITSLASVFSNPKENSVLECINHILGVKGEMLYSH